MASTPSPPPAVPEWRLHSVWERVLVAIFLMMLALPGLATLAGVDAGMTRGENRELAPAPALAPTWTAISGFPAAFTLWFEDHFAFRSRLVRWQAAFRLLVLRVSPSPEVIRGQDGWLFYADDGATEDYLNASPLGKADLDTWAATLQHSHDWLAAQGITYLFVIAPDKHAVYPEFMPEAIRRTSATSRTDQLVAHLRAHTTVPVLDLRPALLAAKPDGRLYHRTDSHWNDLGAFVAAQEILGRLQDMAGDRLPGLAPDRREAFTRADARTSGWDLARMLGLETWLLEDDIRLRPKQRESRVVEPAHPDPDNIEGRLVTEHVRADLPRAVVFRDSFGSALVPFLSEHCSRALYLWEYDVDPAVIGREQPQVVIQEWAGRRLSTRLPYDGVAARLGTGTTPRPLTRSGEARR
ncbi:MAG TPA: hypothetical protein VMW48_09640 [Vicinamibacterales bacterium]|nr:hypothetical protein [Vicinamibacterales bacterium]